MSFKNRSDAGRRLAERLQAYSGRDDLLVLGLPRGGMPVAHEIAQALGAPLDVYLVRKLGVPGHEELAMGAVASHGVLLLDEDAVQRLRLPRASVESAIERERHELVRREELYRHDRPPLEPHGKCVILVDDGLATGSSMLAAVSALQQQDPAKIVAAVPVAPPAAVGRFGQQVDEFIVLETPENFMAVSQWYDDFAQTTDEEVSAILALYTS